MSVIVTPSDTSNGAAVAVEHPQAGAGLRVPEPDIASAGKEQALVLMPGETLNMRSRAVDYLQAVPAPDLPEPDHPVAAS
jgi:hypothetical protein